MRNHVARYIGAALCGFALFASGCANSLADSGEKDTIAEVKKDMVTLSLSVTGPYAASSRSVRPEADIDHYVLVCVRTDWTIVEQRYEQIEGATIALEKGTWDITLEAHKNDTVSRILASVLESVEITDEVSTLEFALKPPAAGTGDIDITVTWPDSIDIDEYEVKVDGVVEKTETVAAGTHSLTYAKASDSGEFGYAFILKKSGKQIYAVSDLVVVAREMTSSKTYALSEADANKAPAAPTNFLITHDASTLSDEYTLLLSWEGDADTTQYFRIFQTDTDGPDAEWTVYTTIGSTRNTYTLDMARGMTRYYKVVAINDFGDSTSIDVQGPFTFPYLVKFDLDGGKIGEATTVSAQEVASGSVVALPADPVKTGYAFDGWYTEANGAGVRYSPTTQVLANATLYAKWNLIEYTLSYTLNGGSNDATNPASYTIESSSITLAAPTRANYTFDGWYTDSNFTGSKIAGEAIAAGSTGNKDFYAKWLPVPEVGATLPGLTIAGIPADKTLSLSETWSLTAELAGSTPTTDYLWEDMWGEENLGYEKTLAVSGSDFWSVGTQWLRVTATVDGVKYQSMVQLTVVRD